MPIAPIHIKNPSTVKFIFNGGSDFLIIRSGTKVYYAINYSKLLGKPAKQSKVNIADPGDYSIESNSEFIFKVEPLEKFKEINLPSKQYDKRTNIKIVFNPTMKHTPARINLSTGILEVNYQFKSLPLYSQKVIIEHEKAHQFYKSELFTDLYAYNEYMKKGGNQSSFITTLQLVLRRNPMNDERIKGLIGAINS
jgi:hypothetical protein